MNHIENYLSTVFTRALVALGTDNATATNLVIEHINNRTRKIEYVGMELWQVAKILAGEKVSHQFKRKTALAASKELEVIKEKHGEDKVIVGVYSATTTIKDHDEVLYFVDTNDSSGSSTRDAYLELGFGPSKDMPLIADSRMPLITAKCFNYKVCKTVIINSDEFSFLYGYDAKEKYNGQIFMAGLTMEKIKSFVTIEDESLYSRAVQCRIMPILTKEVVSEKRAFIIKGLLTTMDEQFQEDVKTFMETEMGIELEPNHIIAFCSEVKLGSNETRLEEKCVVGFSNVPSVAHNMSLGSQTRMHMTHEQHEYILKSIGDRIIHDNVNGCFGRFSVESSGDVRISGSNELNKLAAGGVMPYAVYQQPLENGGFTKDTYYEKVVHEMNKVAKYDARHLGAMSYMVGCEDLVDSDEAILPIEAAERIGERLREFKYMSIDRSPSLLVIGEKTVEKHMRALGIPAITWSMYKDKDFQWYTWHGYNIINIEGFLFCKENLIVIGIDWAENSLLGDFDGDMARCFPCLSERAGSSMKYDPETIKKPNLIRTAGNMLQVIAECRESAKAIGVCAATIASCVETVKRLENAGKPCPDLMDPDFLRLSCMVNGFVDLTKYDLKPVVLFDTKITDLDSFEIAAWKFMHPRQEFDGWAPDGSCYRIGRKNYQQLFSGNTKQLWIDQRIAVETQVQIDLGVPEEVARSVARSVLEGRYNNLAERDYRDIAWAWREKLESELGNDGWVTSHCFAHVRDQMQSKVATNYHEPMSKEELQSVVTKRTQEFLTEQLAYLKRQENKGAPIVPENVLNDQRTRARFITNTISDIFYRLTDKQTGNANFVQEVRDDAEAKEFILKQFSKVLNKEDWAIRRMVMLCSLSNEMKHVKYGKCLPFSLALCTGEFWKWLFQDYAADMDNDQVLI